MIKNGIYNVVSGFVRLGLGIITVPLLIHFLGLEMYGVWILVLATIGIVNLAEAGLAISTTVFISQGIGEKNTDRISQTLTIISLLLLLLAGLAVCILFIASVTLEYIFPSLDATHLSITAQALRLSGVVVAIQLLQRVPVGVEQAYQRYAIFNILQTIQHVLINVGIVVIAYLTTDIVMMMKWYIVVSAALLLAHILTARSLLKHIRLRFVWDKLTAKTIARYSLATWFGTVGGTLFTQADRIIVGAILGPATLGIYGAITTVTIQISVLSSLLTQPILPMISNTSYKGSINQSVKRMFYLNNIAAFCSGVVLFALSDRLLHLLVGDQFSTYALTVFRIMIVIYSLFSLNAIGSYVLLGKGLSSSFAVVQFLAGVVALTCIGIGAHFFGLMGVAFGNAGFLITLLLTVYGMNVLDIPYKEWLSWLKIPALWFILALVFQLLFIHSTYALFSLLLLEMALFTYWLYSTGIFYHPKLVIDK